MDEVAGSCPAKEILWLACSPDGRVPLAALNRGSPYPACPQATGADQPPDLNNFGEIAGYATTEPPEDQECAWTKHPHPAFRSFKPLSIPGADCT